MKFSPSNELLKISGTINAQLMFVHVDKCLEGNMTARGNTEEGYLLTYGVERINLKMASKLTLTGGVGIGYPKDGVCGTEREEGIQATEWPEGTK